MVINNWIAINNAAIVLNRASGNLLQENNDYTPEQLYDRLHCNYPKFFKMDKLSKWAMMGAEFLFHNNDLYTEINRSKIAVVLTTFHGCLDVDKRYYDSISVPSPALFVYTLPNIMLGEICIRYGFKGEQLCMVSESFDPQELYFAAHRLIINGDMDACLCGWVDASGDQYDVCMFWVSKNGKGINFTEIALHELYHRHGKKE